MDCENIKEYFIDYIDGNLSEEEKQKVETHLESCKECSQELLALRSLVNDMNSDNEDIKIPLDFMDNLTARVNKTNFNKKKKIKPLRTILIAAVILTLSVATVFAAKEPILELFKLINPQPRINTLVDKGVGNRLNISKTDKDIKITITEVLADDIQTLISYKIEDLKSGKYYSVPYADGISIDERWGETADYSNMEMYTSQFNFEDKGTLKLFAIDTEEKNIHLTFNKLATSNEGNLETIEGKWDFEIPIKKYSGKSYDLNSTIKIDNYTIDFTKITISPTLTTLYFKCMGGNLQVNSITQRIRALEDLRIIANGKQYKTYDFNYDTIGYGNNEMTFESMYFDNPKDIEIKINRIITETKEDKDKEFIISLDSNVPQEFEYLGTKIIIDNFKIGTDITFDLKQSFDYTKYINISYTFQPQEGHSAEKYFKSGGSYNEVYYVDKDNNKYQYYDALLNWDKIRDKDPLFYIAKTNWKLQPDGNFDIKKEKSMKMIIDGYMETKFVDASVKIKLK